LHILPKFHNFADKKLAKARHRGKKRTDYHE